MLIMLGGLPGITGPNEHGSDPLATPAAA